LKLFEFVPAGSTSVPVGWHLVIDSNDCSIGLLTVNSTEMEDITQAIKKKALSHRWWFDTIRLDLTRSSDEHDVQVSRSAASQNGQASVRVYRRSLGQRHFLGKTGVRVPASAALQR